MTTTWRLLDTAPCSAAENMALDEAVLVARAVGCVPDTLRFLQFSPSCALVGYHQSVEQEVRIAYCQEHGIEINRRLTGGGGLFWDATQLGWEIYAPQGDPRFPKKAEDLYEMICQAAIRGLERLGVHAAFRPANDIEVDGRKISGTGGFFDGDTIFYQGTILVAMDGAKMAGLLNIPAAKLAKHGQKDAAKRIVTLTELFDGAPPAPGDVKAALLEGFARRLGIAPAWGEITEAEERAAQESHDAEIGLDEFVYGIDDPARAADVVSAGHTGPGGTITAHLRLEGPRQDRIREVLFTGDFFVAPPRIVPDLEAALRGVALDEVDGAVNGFFEAAGAALMSAAATDFTSALRAAAAQRG